MTQSKRNDIYQKHLDHLIQHQLIYACLCSRKEIQEHIRQPQGELRYPGTCRDKNIPFNQEGVTLRIKMPDQAFAFDDLFLKQQSQNPCQQCGDFVIKDRLGQWTYQFAVVIDDLEQQINLIVRGQDLLTSTGRQIALQKILRPYSITPVYAHHPLIMNDHGQKLSKRFLDESIASLRSSGLSADFVRGLAAKHARLIPEQRPLALKEFKDLISPLLAL